MNEGFSDMRTCHKKVLAVLFVVCTLYVIVTALNVTTSSLQLNYASASELNTSDVIFGESRPIRSDEWLRSTPFQIGRLHEGSNPNFQSPFEYRSVDAESLFSRTVYTLIFPERRVVETMGSHGFGAIWWFPVVMGFLTVFMFFVVNGRRVGQAVFGAFVVVLAPTTSWWSYSPLEVIWPCLAGAVIVRYLAERDWSPSGWRDIGGRQRALLVSFSTLAGAALSRLPFVYQPWSIPAFLLVGAVTIDLLRSDGLLRRAIRPLLITGATAVLLAGVWYLENRSQYSVLAQTVYPGGRRSEGGGLVVPLFSGVFDYSLAHPSGASIVGTNQSEAALGWLVIPVVTVLVWLVHRSRRVASGVVGGAGRWALTFITGSVMFAWGIVRWPSALLKFNPLQLIPGERIVQILSVVALIPALLGLFRIAEDLESRSRRFAASSGAVVTFVLSLEAGNSLRSNIPQVGIGQVWVVSGVMAVGVFVLVAFPRKLAATFPLLVFAAWSTVTVNPLVRGLGDLVESRSASLLSAEVRKDATMRRVGSDDIFVDALVAANGLPLMSGQQGWGPNRDAYRAIDPQEIFVDQWNRGASYVHFSWDPSLGQDLSVTGSGDQIVISISPCNEGLKDLGLGWVISTTPISADCLTERSVFKWMNYDRWLYEVA